MRLISMPFGAELIVAFVTIAWAYFGSMLSPLVALILSFFVGAFLYFTAVRVVDDSSLWLSIAFVAYALLVVQYYFHLSIPLLTIAYVIVGYPLRLLFSAILQ